MFSIAIILKLKKNVLFLRKLFLLSFIFCFLLLFPIAQFVFSEEVVIKDFNKAEFLFHSGKFAKAKQLYQEYFKTNPNQVHLEKTIFRLGQIDYRNRYYTTALQYFGFLLEKFPDTSLIEQALFLMGVCHFEMRQFEAAERIFKIQIDSNPDASRRWESLLFLSHLDERRFDFDNALEKIRRVYGMAQDKELRDNAVQVAETIISEKLSKETILAFIQRFSSGFPVDLMLWRLIEIYRVERDSENYQAMLQKFVDFFPSHSRRPEADKMLLQVKQTKSQALCIGAILPLTGKHALTGQRVLQGIQLAFNQIRMTEKQKLKLVVKDSGSSLLGTFEEVAADPNVIAIIGPVLSHNVRKVAPLLGKFQIPIFTPTASAAGLPSLSPYIFRNALTREIQGKFLAEYAVNKLNLRRFVIFSPEESFGEEFKDIFSEEVQSLGAEVVAWVTYNRTQNDFKSQILDIGGISDRDLKQLTLKQLAETKQTKEFQGGVPFSKPFIEQALKNGDNIEGLKVSLELSYDAIFIPGFYDKVGLIAPQLVFYNINEVTLLGTNGWNFPDLVETAGKHLRNKGIFVDGFFVHSPEKRVKEFVKKFKANFGEEPTILSAQAFDAAKIILQLVGDEAKTRTKIKNQLQLVENFPGVSGKTTILSSGDSEKTLFPLKIKGKKIVPAN